MAKKITKKEKEILKDLDIEKLELEIERLRTLVYYDDLTGILNRRGFNEQAGKMFRYIYSRHGLSQRYRRSDTMPFSVIFIDIDNFKKINDTYGHDEGDKVLRHVAKIMRTVLRENDIYARFGGEEFVVALPQANKKIALRVAEKLCYSLAESPVTLNGETKQVTMSVGIVMHSEEETLHAMIEKADEAMYQAKKSGKNRVVMFMHGKEESSYLFNFLKFVKINLLPKDEKELSKEKITKKIKKVQRIPSI